MIGRQDGIEVALGRALRIRTADMDLPRTARHAGLPFAPPASGVAMVPNGAPRAFHSEGAELRFVKGAFESPGPATVWVRLRVPVVAGEQPTPLERVATAADFGNGVSSPLSYDDWLFINPDLTIHVSRLPVGEWVGLESRTLADPKGSASRRAGSGTRQGPSAARFSRSSSTASPSTDRRPCELTDSPGPKTLPSALPWHGLEQHRIRRNRDATTNDWNQKIIEEFRSAGGKVGGQFEGAPILLLHSTGAKTGQERTTPMMYLADGDRLSCSRQRQGRRPTRTGTTTSSPIRGRESRSAPRHSMLRPK